MDDKASAAYNALERMLLDATKKPMKLPLSLLEAITDNFSDKRVLGRGGFAVVYKGMLGSEPIAVKKLLETIDVDEEKFMKEIQCLMKLRHKNIVRFLGYCAETQGEIVDYDGKPVLADQRNRLLCFEFVPNGTLQKYITADDASCGLEWGVRYQIIKGICEGLHYLHEKRIVHSDLKPANILIDDNMLPKIADFGLSRCFDEKQSKDITSKLIGSLGYLPPEYLYGHVITPKQDIFSLGVIINEILTGEKGPSTEKNVLLESWNNRIQISERDILLQQVRAYAEIAKMCIDPDKGNRPTIHRIIEMFKELGSADRFDEAGASTTLVAQMDGKASTAEYNVLELMLLDKREKPTKLPLSLLKTITNNFSEEREVARGGFSVVYKGMLVNGTVVAVKKLSKRHDVHGEKFDREVQCLLKVQHKNIVRFLGYCTGAQGEMTNLRKRLLCFEFVPNGSLDEYITDASCGLEWRARYQIIKGICEGLHYLHEKHIVHLDLKPANILLHDNMVPKIADFGISRFLDEKESKTVASKLIGSIGYLAPECYNGEITFKLDIYSLGVLIIEIMTGEKPQNRCSTVQDVLKSWNNRLDLSQDTTFREVRACAEIGRMCTDAKPESRPTTQDIIKKFEELGSADGFEVGASTSSVAQLIGLRKSREGQKGTRTSFASRLLKLIVPGMKSYDLVAETRVEEFSLKDIIRATKNFDPSHCIGEGGFGKVYKGTFRSTTGHDVDLAVKRATNHVAHTYQLNDELRILAKLSHRNVVRLVGFSRKGKKLYLCHELCSKGSLDKYLPGSTNNEPTPLRWSTRYEIIRGVCAGLQYLHELCNNTISHMDLKPSNILLDERMMPKIADFGLSRAIANLKTHTYTATVIGTGGYMAPELWERGRVSCKCDIYSLGVLIMGIVMGGRPMPICGPSGIMFIRSVREKFIFEGATTRSLGKCSARDRAQLKSDASLQDDDCLEDVEKCIGLALQCVDEDPEKRPLATYIYGRLPIATLLLTATSQYN
ncbi:unnamed protein product [Urochloa decumbens]|uniref:non-specific serine/threonine protein kinase n=1 Tax=Urochloa decumbens TaxID=240449 RepID=A0ABC8ZPT7_9POAL